MRKTKHICKIYFGGHTLTLRLETCFSLTVSLLAFVLDYISSYFRISWRHLIPKCFSCWSTVESVWLGYGLDNRGSVPHTTQIGPGAHPASFPVGTGVVSSGVKLPGSEANNSPPSAEVKNAWSYTSNSSYVCLAWCLIKRQGQLYFSHLSAIIAIFSPKVFDYALMSSFFDLSVVTLVAY
jgi:hypothetical protein